MKPAFYDPTNQISSPSITIRTKLQPLSEFRPPPLLPTPSQDPTTSPSPLMLPSPPTQIQIETNKPPVQPSPSSLTPPQKTKMLSNLYVQIEPSSPGLSLVVGLQKDGHSSNSRVVQSNNNSARQFHVPRHAKLVLDLCIQVPLLLILLVTLTL